MQIDATLDKLIGEYWRDYEDKKGLDIVVRPSIPIIWFGNLEEYRVSELKVVTVGLNPSDAEFPKDKNGIPSFSRFIHAGKIANKSQLENGDKSLLVDSYNNYFSPKSYTKWFGSFQSTLDDLPISVDYYGKKENRAIHIDFRTAIATNPTWGKLSKSQCASIENEGLFFELLNYLTPDIVLLPNNDDIIDKIGCNIKAKFSHKTIAAAISVGVVEREKESNQLFIFGRNMGVPFNCIDKETRRNIFKQIFNKYK